VINPISIGGPGVDFQLPKLDDAAPAQGVGGQGFGGMLGKAIQSLDDTLAQSSTQANALATGQATDVTAVVNDVERAQLELQMATQFRNKAVDAYNDIFRMQI
jgi:flagellar hook-basal body complex protein FliE